MLDWIRIRLPQGAAARRLSIGVIAAALALALLSTPGGVQQAVAACVDTPILTWSSNGHEYQMICGSATDWTSADLAAKAKGAHLATITSSGENNFIRDNFPNIVAWIGGFQPASASEPGGGWSWVSGEAFSYTNWRPSEPNDAGDAEDHLTFNWDVPGGWNDYHGANSLAYIIEWEDRDGDGIADSEDNCPDDSNKDQDDSDDDGKGDACDTEEGTQGKGDCDDGDDNDGDGDTDEDDDGCKPAPPTILDNNQGRFLGGALFSNNDTAAQNRARANAAGVAAAAAAARAAAPAAAVRPPSTGDAGLAATDAGLGATTLVAALLTATLLGGLGLRLRRQR